MLRANVRTWSCRKPRSTRVIFQKLRNASPAPPRSVSASANSITMRERRNPWRLGVRLDLPLSFNELLRFQREDCQAGAQPQSTPASNIAARLKNSTGRFKRTSASVGIENGGNMATIAFSIAQARLTPRMPPISARARLSVKNCMKSCERFAPREARIATSF